MLLYRTFLKDTETKGVGLFAAELIPKGAIWWKDDREFNRIISASQMDCLPEAAREFVTTYGSLGHSGEWYICLDNARFVNHSSSPNTAHAISDERGSTGDWVATRDISIGEEIVSDYGELCLTCKDGLPFEDSEGNDGNN